MAKKKKLLRNHFSEHKDPTKLFPVATVAPKAELLSRPSHFIARKSNDEDKKILHIKPWPPINIPSPRGANQILIIDAFTFNFELDLLEIRLNELKHVVDYHILVESAHDLYGNTKRLYFDEHKYEKRFLKYRNKIIHIPIRDWVENKTGM